MEGTLECVHEDKNLDTFCEERPPKSLDLHTALYTRLLGEDLFIPERKFLTV